jgi:hypothetical protein
MSKIRKEENNMKKNMIKCLVIVGVAAVIIITMHLAGSNLMEMIKNHMGI